MELCQRTKKDHRQSDQQWSCVKGRGRTFVSQASSGIVSKNEKGPSSVRPALELCQRTRKDLRQLGQQWNCVKGRERTIVSQTSSEIVPKDEKGPSSVRPAVGLCQRTRKGPRQSPAVELCQRTTKDHRQSDQQWNCVKANTLETCDRLDRAHMGLSEHVLRLQLDLN